MLVKNKKNNSQRRKRNPNDPLRGVSLPVPSLPRWVGSALSLSSKNSVSPNRVFLDIPILPNQINSSVAGPPWIAQAIPIDQTLLPNFAALATVYKEFCVVGFRGEVRFLTSTISMVVNPSGFVLVAVDEKDASAPTFASIKDLSHMEVLNSPTESPSRHLIAWIPQDLEDLQWQFTDAATPNTPAWLKFYADSANTFFSNGSTITSAFGLTGCMRVMFRGLQ
jgi:hypothetical protein